MRRLLGLVAAGLAASAHATSLDPARLADLSIEELANVDVTSVSRHAERLADVAASVFVITGDDIRRSSATSLPEALRLAPNLQVARIDARNYAVSARGFNNAFSNKLLMMIDGRTVYSPLFSGVFWDAQDIMLEDVERIEVISGPGATIWGANAVDGVINIITKAAGDTQGGLLSAEGSRREHAFAGRYGGTLPLDGRYRVYAKLDEQDDEQRTDGRPDSFGMHRHQAGFHADWRTGPDALTLQGDAYHDGLRQAGTADIATTGFNLLGRWDQHGSDDTLRHYQVYVDRTTRNQPGAYQDRLDTLDIEAHYGNRITPAQLLTWGGGYRLARDRIVPSTNGFAFLPGSLDMRWGSLFAQDEIDLASALKLTLGTKLEHNGYTGSEWLPSLRLAYRVSPSGLLWGEVSRAVRAPSRIDRDFFVPAKPPFLIDGGPDFRSEVAKVAEIGYRAQPSARFSYSATVFYDHYERLRSGELDPAIPAVVLANGIRGQVSGIEAWGNWQALDHWRLSLGAVAQRERFWLAPGSHDTAGLSGQGDDPKHYWTLRSLLDLPANLALDLTVRGVGALSASGVPAYCATDVRIGWQPRRDMEISLIGLNLFDGGHPEFAPPPTQTQEAREAYLRVQYRF